VVTCSRCGWEAAYPAHDCSAELGRIADSLAQSINVFSTKIGYGDRQLVFEVADNLRIRVEPYGGGGFYFREIGLIGRYSAEDTKELIEAIRATKIGSGTAKEVPWSCLKDVIRSPRDKP
jgi:hypothetical protein